MRLTGRERAVAGQELENFAREQRGLTRLSGSDSGAQAIVRTGPKANPESVQRPTLLTPEDVALAVFAAMEDDVVGGKARAALRSQIVSKVNLAWNESQRQRPGPRSPSDYAQYQAAVEEGTNAAVKSFARLKLTRPVDVMVDIAASKALLVFLLLLAPLFARGESFQTTNRVANGDAFNGWPTNTSGHATGTPIGIQSVRPDLADKRGRWPESEAPRNCARTLR